MIPMILFALWVLGWGALVSVVVIVFLRRYVPKSKEISPWEVDIFGARKPGDAPKEADRRVIYEQAEGRLWRKGYHHVHIHVLNVDDIDARIRHKEGQNI